MRKVRFAVLALLLTLALTSVAFAHICPDYFTTFLVAGGGNAKSAMVVGDVKVCQGADCEGGDVLKVHYWAFDGWCITETHLQVATELDGIPQKNGNPVPGHFDYSGEHDCVESVTYYIPDAGWSVGQELYIAAHAVVENGCQEETAWGGWDIECSDFPSPVSEFPGRNWATYFTYTVQSPE